MNLHKTQISEKYLPITYYENMTINNLKKIMKNY